MYLADMTQLE